MIARRIGRMFAIVVLFASGTYFFVYLWRWEWNRATVAGILFLAAEIGLGTAAVLDRLRQGQRMATPAASPPAGLDPAVSARLRETAPAGRDYFAWLSPRRGHVGVFVPVLMGMGVVASSLAWLVERLARATARPALERRLAARLAPLSWPSGGLAHADPDPTAILTRPLAR